MMKMLKKEKEQWQTIEMVCTDMLVPKGHFLRKIDAAVDFRHIYELVEDLYCEDNGRPSCNPRFHSKTGIGKNDQCAQL